MKTSEYFGVSKDGRVQPRGTKKWRASIAKNGQQVQKFFHEEREAALWIDKCLIEQGKEPKNILKRV